MKMFIFVGLTK